MRKTFLIAILIALIVGILILIFRPLEKGNFKTEFKEGQVTIKTDKKEYEQGEIIEITIRNNLDKEIFGGYCHNILSDWTLQKLVDGSWKEIPFWLPLFDNKNKKEYCVSSFSPEQPACTKKWEPHSEVVQRWNQKICPYEKSSIKKPILIEKGVYRLAFTYGFQVVFKPPEFSWFAKIKDPKVIYSNEFIIKEKQPINTSNWQTYCDEKYGFEFKYPSNWTVRKDYFDDREELTILPPQIGQIQPTISVHIYHSGIPFDEWVNERFSQLRSFFPGDYPPLKKIIINGKNAFRSEAPSPKGRCRMWISKDSYICEIEGPIVPSDEAIVNDFESLINTFRWEYCGKTKKNQTITTDKTEYERGEEVKITLNTNGNTLYFEHYNNRVSYYRLVDGNWELIPAGDWAGCHKVSCRDGVIESICREVHSPYCKKVNNILEKSWDQKMKVKKRVRCGKDIVELHTYQNVPPGTYKVKIDYFKDSKCQGKVYSVYSNEFIIKEKEISYKTRQAYALGLTLEEFEVLDSSIHQYLYAQYPFLRKTQFEVRYEKVNTEIENFPQGTLVIDAYTTFRTPPVVVRAAFYEGQAYIISHWVEEGLE